MAIECSVWSLKNQSQFTILERFGLLIIIYENDDNNDNDCDNFDDDNNNDIDNQKNDYKRP